jgi:DNA replication protein DnaC
VPFRTALIWALDAEWRRDHQAYEQPTNNLNTPYATAWREMRAWDQCDREKVLTKEWRASIFDEKFGLDQVYVPLRAGYYPEIKRPNSSRDMTVRRPEQDTDSEPERERLKTPVKLDPEIHRWLAKSDPDVSIRVIAGGPGSGKSSFMKALAADLVQKRGDGQAWHVLFVHL